MPQPLRFTLNGVPTTVAFEPGESLLEVLRERCGITTVKDACRPQGQCGACLALVDGKPKTTCALPADKAQGKEIVTLEGLDAGERELLARGFVAAAGLQCGFCTPGIALRTKRLLDEDPEIDLGRPHGDSGDSGDGRDGGDGDPDAGRAAIARALSGHLCRCTGYQKIVDAVVTIAQARRGAVPPPEPLRQGGVGASLARHEGEAMVLGERPFVDDLRLEDVAPKRDVGPMLHGVVVLAPVTRETGTHARLDHLDTTAAAAMPGVVRVATAADVPGQRFYGLIYDDWPGLVAVGEEVRSAADVVAVVAAETDRQARAAAAKVEVALTPLPGVYDPEDALAPDAPLVNPRHASNVLSRTRFVRGDVDAALAASAFVVRETFETQRIEHAFLEPEAALAVPRPGYAAATGRVGEPATEPPAALDDRVAADPLASKLHLYTQGQGVFDDRRQVAAYLGVPEERVHVELVPNGGAFGGKEDLTVQAHAALLAHLTGRPVKVRLNREESVRMHPKRHPIRMTYEVGCDAAGHLTAVRAHLVGDTGAYASVGGKVLERAAGHACGPYRVPAADVHAVAVMTNNPPCGAMRGFGANQAAFAIEGCLDRLADLTGMDPWELRWRNAVVQGDRLVTGQVLDKPLGLRETLEAVRPAYERARAAGHPVGIAAGLKNTGLGNGAVELGKARLVVGDDGTVTLYNGYTEMGQGLFTVLTQFASEVAGLPARAFLPRVDATFDLAVGQTTGSRATLFGGRAVTEAARALAGALAAAEATGLSRGEALRSLAGQVFAGDVTVDDTDPPGTKPDPKVHTSYGLATQVVELDAHGRLLRVVAAHDVGRAVNPALVEGQIEGAVAMGLGYALTEELPCDHGVPVTHSMRELGLIRAQGIPRVDVHLVEVPEPEGPFGAKGVGEIGLVPTAAAVAGAVAAHAGATGAQRPARLPMKDTPAAKALGVGRIRAKGSDPADWR